MIYQRLIEYAKKSRFRKIFRRMWRIFAQSYYPFVMGNEFHIIKNILKSGVWNMSSEDGFHVKLETKFAEYLGVKHAILVSSGGMAIQMSLRALGLKPGDEVIIQVDTCVADAFAILNAGVTPIFSDISLDTFKLNMDTIESLITSRTRAIMPIHLWGNAENMGKVIEVAKRHNLKVIEDCALAIGATYNGKRVGQFGDLGIFSFGSTKPLQSGEGGFIVTNDDIIAKELYTIRNWGDKTHEYGIRDQEVLSWNGRTSEITAGLIYEQLRNYNKLLKSITSNAKIIIDYVEKCPYLELADDSAYNDSPIYSLLALRIDSKINKSKFMDRLKEENISVWHANFEPITTLTFFSKDKWKDWVLRGDLVFVENNYKSAYKNSTNVYNNLGIGIMRNSYTTEKKAKNVVTKIKKILSEFNL